MPWAKHPLWHVVGGSVPLGAWGGIRFRAHASLLWCIATVFVYAAFDKSLGLKGAITGVATLCTLLVLHELGHCLVSLRVGGRPGEIVFWPLGGLTSAGAPHSPGACFAVSLGGPLVNAFVCLLATFLLLAMRAKGWGAAFNPLRHAAYVLPFKGAAYFAGWVLVVSWILLLFNMLPILPLDGGHLLWAVLWRKLGAFRAMSIASLIGMAGSFGLMIAGLTPPIRGAMLVLAIMLYAHCLQQRLMLRQMGEDDSLDDRDETPEVGADPQHRRRRRRLSRWRLARARLRAEKDRAELERVDIILAKVSARGIRSLTWMERRVLRQATDRRRRSEAEFPQDPPSS